jgi:hypothetical protein
MRLPWSFCAPPDLDRADDSQEIGISDDGAVVKDAVVAAFHARPLRNKYRVL